MDIQKSKKKGFQTVLYGICILFLFLLMSIPVSAATVYSVKFTTQDGTGDELLFRRLEKVARYNQLITLPVLSDTEEYQMIGWTTSKDTAAPLYKTGSTVSITESVTYYLVRKKIEYCTVRFYSNDTGKLYSGLSLKVAKGNNILLPDIPVSAYESARGWTTVKTGTRVTNKIGSSVKVKKNMKFYGITKKKPTVALTLYSYDGETKYTTITVVKGGTCKLPGLMDPAGYTMMGWAVAPGQNVATSSKYYVGETITLKKNTVLYAAMFPNAAEIVRTIPGIQKYQKVIFVGDSRIYRLGVTLAKQDIGIEKSVEQENIGEDVLTRLRFSPQNQTVSFVGRNSSGLSWLKKGGYSLLMQEIGDGVKAGEAPIAVIFNHGINDLHNQSAYISYMKSLAQELEPLGCRLFYMSVNPANSKILKSKGAVDIREEERVRAFNQAIEKELCGSGSYLYLNTYNYFMRFGFSYDRNYAGEDTGIDDGAHYSVNTCKVIYWYCITKLNQL